MIEVTFISRQGIHNLFATNPMIQSYMQGHLKTE